MIYRFIADLVDMEEQKYSVSKIKPSSLQYISSQINISLITVFLMNKNVVEFRGIMIGV